MLRHHNSLQKLKFASNNFSEKGFVEIFNTLRNSHSLTTLNVSYSALGEAAVDELVELMKASTSITRLLVKGNPYMSERLEKKLLEAAGNSVDVLV